MNMQLKIRKIAILGANGMLGSDLVNYFSETFEVTGITRENYKENIDKNFDILINANGNSRRYWANQNPEADYEASVLSVKNSLNDFKFSQYIFISSSDIYPEHGNPQKNNEDTVIDTNLLEPYGLHKYQAEQLVNKLSSYTILRCSAMLGRNLKKGIIFDLKNNQSLFVTKESYLQFITTAAVAEIIEYIILNNINKEIFNCGGVGHVTIEEIADLMTTPLNFQSNRQKQEYEMNINKLYTIYPLKNSSEYLFEYLNNK